MRTAMASACVRLLLVTAFSCFSIASGKDIEIAPLSSSHFAHYYWQTLPVGNSAQMVTLFCNQCGYSEEHTQSVPLLSVLRDTLGDDRTDNDRLSYVWLLSLTHQNLGKQFLAAVPFFYWRVGDGSTRIDENHRVKPLMDLTKPEQPMAVQVMRDVLQWTVLDPVSMPVRATSRAYQTNTVAQERVHLEEAIGYLRGAPKLNSGEGLSQAETDTVIARLALRESLLGGLVGEHQAQRVGERANAGYETVRSRNWDLLRGFAERTGLLFEPLDVSGTAGEYGLLWFPTGSGVAEPVGSSHSAVWKALNLRDPWADERLRSWEGPVFRRSLDENGSLLPAGSTGGREVKLIPLGAYSLTYPKFPLLMIDFRDKLHVRRNEMTQRAINEVTSGVIGISHFTNWYYYAGASAYDFVASRHGRGMDAALRLSSYAQFRSALALDDSIDPKLRGLLQQRIDSLSVNPLEGSAEHAVQIANAQYAAFRREADSGELDRQLDRTREAELANFGRTQQSLMARAFVRGASFNLFPSRHKENEDLIAQLDRNRRVQADLSFLDAAVNSGPNPEIAYDAARLREAVQDLSLLLPDVQSKNVRTAAALTLNRLNAMTKDHELQAGCSLLLATLRQNGATGIAAASKVFTDALRPPDMRK